MSTFRAVLTCFAALPFSANAVDWAYATNEIVSIQISGQSDVIGSIGGGNWTTISSQGFATKTATIFYGADLIADVPQQITGLRTVAIGSFSPPGENNFIPGAGRDSRMIGARGDAISNNSGTGSSVAEVVSAPGLASTHIFSPDIDFEIPEGGAALTLSFTARYDMGANSDDRLLWAFATVNGLLNIWDPLDLHNILNTGVSFGTCNVVGNSCSQRGQTSSSITTDLLAAGPYRLSYEMQTYAFLTPVPEVEVFALMTVGLLAMVFRKRRRDLGLKRPT